MSSDITNNYFNSISNFRDFIQSGTHKKIAIQPPLVEKIDHYIKQNKKNFLVEDLENIEQFMLQQFSKIPQVLKPQTIKIGQLYSDVIKLITKKNFEFIGTAFNLKLEDLNQEIKNSFDLLSDQEKVIYEEIFRDVEQELAKGKSEIESKCQQLAADWKSRYKAGEKPTDLAEEYSEDFIHDSLDPIFDQIEKKVKDLPTRIHSLHEQLRRKQDARIQELIDSKLKEMEDKSLSYLKLSRREFTFLPYSLTLFQGQVLRHTHKSYPASSQIERIYSIQEGIVGKGGVNIAYKMMNPEGELTHVRSVLIDPKKDKEKLDRRIEATKISAFQKHPHILVGHHTTHESKKTGEIKEGFIAPFRKSDFEKLILTHTIPEKTIIKAFLQIISALETIHGEGFCFLDLKPANIFVDYDPKTPDKIHIWIADFDFARKLEDKPLISICGSPEYMSPEMARGGGLDKKGAAESDLFSAGVSFYEILNRHPLINTQNMQSAIECIVLMASLTYKEIENQGFAEPDDKTSLSHFIWEIINPKGEFRPKIPVMKQRLEILLSR